MHIRTTRYYALIMLLAVGSSLTISTATGNILTGNSFFSPRSENSNTAQSIIQWRRYWMPPTDRQFHGTVSIMPEYTRSFRPERLAQHFFGTSSFYVSGSESAYRSDQDFLADYFGLSPAFSSLVTIKPFGQSAIVQADIYLAKGNWWFAVHLPVVWKATSMDLSEVIFNNGSETPFPANYMTSDALRAPFLSFAEAIQGAAGYGDVTRLLFGKISCGQLHRVGLADVHLVGGWNFINQERGHFGLTAHLIIPTGNHSKSEFIFEPIVGNGHHWEFGIGFTGHTLLWQRGIDQEFNLVVEGQFTHLVGSRQRRSFDFNCNFGSRYILAKQFQNGDYTRTSLPAINVTTYPCTISADIQMDISVMLTYKQKNLELDIGYNAWVRSHEKARDCECFANSTYALKGIQNVTTAFNTPSNATQSTATLQGNPFANQASVADPNPPVYFSMSEINCQSDGSPLSYTNKAFWHINYMLDENKARYCIPYIGLGGEVEFEGYRPKNVAPNKDSMAQWGVWILLGVTC